MALTQDQRNSLWDKSGQPVRGLRLLSARPGTGKTTTLTEYCIDVVTLWSSKYQPWQGMAIVSYTNVAKDELESKIRHLGKANTLLKSPNFVGTLDAFVNQQLFLPHGAPIMQYNAGRPMLVGEPYHQWKPLGHMYRTCPTNAFSPLFFDCYSVSINGTPFLIDSTPRQMRAGNYVSAPKVTSKNMAKILSMKRHVWGHGLALQSDANYIAHEALRASTALTRALVGRFPVLIVDEAQDMTEIQHALIDHLVTAGLQHVILIGDENQAIYEWNTARPQLFIAKRVSTTWRATTLAGTFRCSPAISAVLTSLAHDGIVVRPAVGAKNTTYNAPVDIRPYEPDQLLEAIDKAITSIARALTGKPPHCDNPADVKSIAVLTRSAEHARTLQAAFTGMTINTAKRASWNNPLTRDYLRVIYHLKHRDTYGAIGAYEALLVHATNHDSIADMRAAQKTRQGLLATDTVGYRLVLSSDLTKIASALPTTAEFKTSDCGACCSVGLALLNRAHLMAIKQDCDSFAKSAKEGQDRLLSTLFTARSERTWISHPDYPDMRLIFSTAHGAKGETHDAVVFYTKKRIFPCGCPRSAATWQKILGHRIIDCETKRIAYVALSRAAQMLVILTPVEAVDHWKTHTAQDDDKQYLC